MATLAHACLAADPTLEKRVEKLEKAVSELKAALAPVIENAKAEQVVTQQRNNATKPKNGCEKMLISIPAMN